MCIAIVNYGKMFIEIESSETRRTLSMFSMTLNCLKGSDSDATNCLKLLTILERNFIIIFVSMAASHLKCKCFYASGCFQIVAGDTINTHKSTVSQTIHRVSNALRNRLNRWVQLPSQRDADKQKTKFYAIAGFPNVFGCVDGIHIKIQGPSEHENEFVNRKGYHSINVQLVCDSDINIINCIVKYPGSTHDARILTESKIYRDFETHPRPINGYVLGDSVYPLKEWLMTPILNTNNDAARERYNRSLSSTRQTTERCNGLLKRQFPCLKETLRYSLKRAVVIIMACIVLHNMAVHYKLPDPEDDEHDDHYDAELYGGQPALSARAERDSLVRRSFS